MDFNPNPLECVDNADSPSQVLLAWQHAKQIVFNPRSMRASHMRENLSPEIANTVLSPAEMRSLDRLLRDTLRVGDGVCR